MYSFRCMSRTFAITRRRILSLCALVTGVAVAGCQEGDEDGDGTGEGEENNDEEGTVEDPTPTATPSPTPTSTPTPDDGDREPRGFARTVTYWTWYQSADDQWNRTTEPYDVSTTHGRWFAGPTEDGSVRCRIEGDEASGYAGFSIDIGQVGNLHRITVESERTRSDGRPGEQRLRLALLLDVTGTGDFFEWEETDDRETFSSYAGDLECTALVPADGISTIDDTTTFEFGPPFDGRSVTLEDLRTAAIDAVHPLTDASVQLSVVGSGGENVEEALVHDVELSRMAAVPSSSWSMFSYDKWNSGFNRDTSGPAGPVEPRWEFDTDGPVHSSPAVVRDQVYVGSDDGTVYAIDSTTGGHTWSFETGGPVRSSPAIVDHKLFVGSNDHHVYSLNAAIGEERWRFETGGPVRSSPTVETQASSGSVQDPVAFGSDDGTMYVVEAEDGRERLTVDTDGPIVSAPMIYLNQFGVWEVGVGSLDEHTYWLVPSRPDHRSDVTVAHTGGRVYASLSAPATRASTFWYRANDAGTLKKFADAEWTFQADAGIRTTPVPGDDTVYVGSQDGTVYAIDEGTGEPVWEYETGDAVDSSPALVDGVVYVGSRDGNVYALDADEGEPLWSFETGGGVVSSPAVSEGTVYVGSTDGSLYALADRDG